MKTRLAAVWLAVLAGSPFGARGDWVRTSGPSGASISAIDFVSPSEVFVATGRGRVFRSVNGGAAWTEVATLPPARTLVLGHQGGDVFAGKFGSGMWRSSDHGQSWQDVSAGLPGDTVRSMVVQGGLLFVQAELNFVGSLSVSADHGQNWETLATPEPAGPLATNGQTLYMGGLQGLYRSSDGGHTWQLGDTGLLGSGGVDQVMVLGSSVIIDNHTFVMRSTDGGNSFSLAPGFPPTTITQTMASDGVTGYIAVQGIPGVLYSVYRSTDMGATWQIADDGLPLGLDRFANTIGVSAQTALLGTFSDIFRTNTPTPQWSASSTGIIASNVLGMATSGNTLFAGVAGSGRIFRSSDGGAVWTASAAGMPADAQTLSVSTAGGAVFSGTQYDGLFRSTDGGQTFASSDSGIPTYNGTAGEQHREISGVVAHQGSLFAATGIGTEFFNQGFQTSGAGVFRSANGGASWQAVHSGFPIIGFNGLFEPVFDPVLGVFDGGAVLLTGNLQTGIWRTSNLGASWSPGRAGLPHNGAGLFPVFQTFTRFSGDILAAAVGFADGGPGGTGVYRSSDQGVSWTRSDAGLPDEHPVLEVLNVGGIVYAAVEGFLPDQFDGVYASTDGGRTWARVGSGLNGAPCEHLAAVNGVVFVAVGASGVWRLASECYANCDGSTGAPVLSINDFVCFISRFAAGDSYANCDGSTGTPALTVNDFVCFGQRFAAGCQ